MSKYTLKAYPQAQWRFMVYDNIRKLEPAEIVKETGCTDLINLGYFALKDYDGGKAFSHQCGVMLGGVWACAPQWDWPGICVSADGVATVGGIKDAIFDYVASAQADYIGNQRTNTKTWDKNGVTYTGFLADGTLVAMISGKDDGLNSVEAVQIMRDAGCVTVLRWDGSWSSRGRIGGKYIIPSQHRVDRTYLLIYRREEKEEKPMKKVCIDAGHGAETSGKCSPDRTYFEHEFTLDMARRQKKILERHGVEVTLTRNDEHDITHPQRCKIANGIQGLDLFVSDHSNAANNDGWSAPRGYLAYTSAPGDSANRNIAAKKILEAVKSAGIAIWSGGLAHEAWYVCKNVVAPAVLIEHGFHTNREETELLKTAAYREKLAEADCRGILGYLGIAWKPEGAWYDESRRWAMEHGISDGTRPEDTATRAEIWEMLRKFGEGK